MRHPSLRATARLAPAACGLAVLCAGAGCATDRAGNGALAGSLAGAALGAAVGEANDEPLAGALIGGLGGAVAGGVIGEQIDRAEADAVRRASHTAPAGPAPRSGVSVAEVIDLTLAGVDAGVIETHIRQRGGTGPLGTHDLIHLSGSGVDPRVVSALQTASPPAAVPVGPHHLGSPAPETVIVKEHIHHGPGWVPVPVYDPFGPGYCPPPRVRRRLRRRCPPPRSGVSVGFHFD